MTVLATALTEELDTSATSAINFSKAPTVNGDPVAVVTGTVARATALATPQNITIGGVTRSFNGTTGIVWTLSELGALGSTATAASATKLATTRTINGTNFDGTANITTSTWGSARNFTIGATTKSVNGGSEVTWTLSELGAFPATGGTFTGDVTISKSTPRLELVNTASSNKAWNIDVSGTNLRISESGVSARLTLSAGGAGTYTGTMNFTQPPTVGSKPIYYEGNEPSTPEIPYPDVWIPFNSNLNMLEGYGDEIQVGGYTVATRASFTRASTATYIDKSGVLRTAAINEPRFEKEGLLIEGQSTNLVVNSLFTSDWSQVRSVVEQKATTSPDGTNNAVKLRCDSSANNSHRTGPSIMYTAGVIYTASVFAKAAELNQVAFRFFDTTFGSSASVVFNLEGDGSFSGPDGYNPTIRRLPNGWYRIEASKTATVTFTGGITIDLIKNGLMNFDGDGVSGVYLYGGQVEALPFATSYIPTNGATATRAGDVCSVYVSNAGERFGDYTAFCEVHTNGDSSTIGGTADTARGIYLIDSNPDSYAHIRNRGNKFYHLEVGTNWQQCSSDVPYQNNITFGTRETGPAGAKTRSVCVNGVLNTTSSAYTHTPTNAGSVVRIGNAGRSEALTYLNGHIRNFRIWHRALSDKQLSSLR